VTDYRFPFDEEIFRAINGLDWGWLNELWVILSTRTFGVFVAVAMGLWVVFSLRRKAIRPILQVGITMLITDQLGHEVLKPFFHRLRPCFALPSGSVHQLMDISSTSGAMPSLHAGNSFAFATALALCLPGSKRFTFPVAVLIALSRIGVGVHWPSDIIAGAIYGALVALGVHLVFQRVVPANRSGA
jgi:undecaprenyl-diphosphatase